MNVYVREVGRQLARRGIEVDVFTRAQNPKVDRVSSLGDGARVIHITAGPEAPFEKDQGWLYVPQFGRGILDFVKAERTRYDIIHSHYWLSGWAGLRLCRDLGAPLVHMFHTLGVMKNMVARHEKEKETALRILLEKRLMDLSQMIVASSPADRAHMVWHYGANPDKIEVIPCGVDLNLFNPLPQTMARAHLGLPPHRLILFVGRILPIKGLECLMNALSILIRRSSVDSRGIRLLIVGGDLENGAQATNGEMERLKGLTAQLGLDSMVIFLGPQPQHVLPYFYSAAEVCVLPSRYESFGMVALESMACGTPVIASGVGGLNYTVRDEQTGYLIPEGNALALADRIDRLLKDNSLRHAMGRQGTRHAEKYSWGGIVHQLMSLYGRILAQRISRGPEMDVLSSAVTGQEIRSCLGSS
jgi:D-inositol-3-phosphate glycosyltransferase